MNFDNYEGTAIDVEMFNPVEGNIETTPIDSTETDVTETADPTNEGIVTETQTQESGNDIGEVTPNAMFDSTKSCIISLLLRVSNLYSNNSVLASLSVNPSFINCLIK